MVTCQRQPALGCVYKMVEINGQPRIKLSQEVGKVTIPGKKDAFRLYGADGYALIDLLQRSTEEVPQVKHKVLCRHPFQESKRAYVIPSRVESLHKVNWSSINVYKHDFVIFLSIYNTFLQTFRYTGKMVNYVNLYLHYKKYEIEFKSH